MKTKMAYQSKITVVYTPEQFKELGEREIVRFIEEHRNVAIVGDELGVDRHIIKYKTVKDWTDYRMNNPYSKGGN